MRSIILSSLLFFVGISAYTQTVDSDYFDGRLWVKFDHTKPLRAPFEGNGKVLEKFIPINKTDRTYFGLLEFNKSFYFTSSPILKSTYEVVFSEIHKIDEFISRLESLPNVDYVEKQPLKRKFQNPPNDYYYVNQTGSATYGGPFNWKWHLDQINAETAWNYSTGNSNIKVAVVDDAVLTSHPDLQGKVVSQHYPGTGQSDCDPPNVTNWQQDFAHGTHVAGLVAANTNNSIGIASIGYDVSIIGVRAADSYGQLMYTTQGVAWAADNGADVINMSYGSVQYSQTEEATMNYAYNNKGVVLVAAVGNDGVNSNQYPAALTNVIAVGSVDENDDLSSFSNFGNWIDVCAPGGYASNFQSWTVLSTVPYNQTGTSSAASQITDQYDCFQGTSMSSPIVAGLCGLILSKNSSLTPAQVRNCIESTCVNIDAQNPSKVGMMGSGRIDAGAAMACASQGTQSAPVAGFTANTTTININQAVNFTDQSTNSPTSWSWSITPNGNINFVNGTNATTQNPVVQFNATGVYSVTLTCSNAYGSDTETKNSYINVVQSGGNGNSTGSCDTLSHLNPMDTLTVYQIGGTWGFLTGNNGYQDKAKAEKFLSTSSPNQVLTGALFYFYQGTGTGTFNIKAWDDSGTNGNPGAEFASGVGLYSSVSNDVMMQSLSYIPFTTVGTITSDYYVGVELTYNSTDSLTLISTTNKPTNGAWEQWNDNTWHSFTSSYNLNIHLAVFPVVCDAVTGVERIDNSFSVRIYPTPASNQLDFKMLLNYTTEVMIYNNMGQVVYQTQTDQDFRINTSRWAEGSYFVQMKNQLGSKNQHIQIIR